MKAYAVCKKGGSFLCTGREDFRVTLSDRGRGVTVLSVQLCDTQNARQERMHDTHVHMCVRVYAYLWVYKSTSVNLPCTYKHMCVSGRTLEKLVTVFKHVFT